MGADTGRTEGARYSVVLLPPRTMWPHSLPQELPVSNRPFLWGACPLRQQDFVPSLQQDEP
jgi:hypothetical protein